MSVKVYLMAILDNYMFRPLLANFRLSLRELKVLLYTLCAHVWCGDLYMPLHNTSAARTFKLDTSHHTLPCL